MHTSCCDVRKSAIQQSRPNFLRMVTVSCKFHLIYFCRSVPIYGCIVIDYKNRY